MKRSVAILVAVGLCTVVADQLTKYIAVARLTPWLSDSEGVSRLARFYSPRQAEVLPHAPVAVVEGYATLRYVENAGPAFRVLRPPLQRPVLLGSGALAIGFLLFLFFRTGAEQRALQVALSCLIGGAAGNFLDRLARGYVIDFVELHWRDDPALRWPTANVADLGIALGVALILREILRAHPAPRPAGLAAGLSRP